MLILIICSVIISLLAYILIDKWQKKYDTYYNIPGPPGLPIIENALDFLMDPVKLWYYFKSLVNVHKDLFKIKLGPKKFVIIYNPEDVETIISGTKNNNKGFLYGFIQPWLKQGLLLSKGAKWHQRRKVLTPAFHFNILRHFKSVLAENSSRLVDKLQKEVDKPKTEVENYITEFTLHSICETAMGTQLENESQEGKHYKDSIYNFGKYVVHRAQRVWMYPDLIFYNMTSIGRKSRKVLKTLSTFRDKVINKRRHTIDFEKLIKAAENEDIDDVMGSSKKRLAMLDLLLQAEKEGVIDAEGIGEEVDTFMFEGHDTTATSLQFTLMLLANFPDVQEKVFQECNEILGCSEKEASMADLSRMKYLEACIKESLRLFPPVHFISRNIEQTIKLKDYEISPGTDVTIFIYDLQRRSDQFREPLEYRPERFMQESTWHPYAYIPFSAGPRNCIGQKFAMIEIKLALSAVVRRYKLLPVTKYQDVVFIVDFILRSELPIYVKFEKRDM